MIRDIEPIDKFFRFFEKHFTKIFITFSIIIFFFWSIAAFLAVKTVGEINQYGLKTVIERLWEGPK